LIHVQPHTLTDTKMVSISVIFNKENESKMDRKGVECKSAGWICVKIQSIGGCCEHDNDPSGTITGGKR
jgi:hypothetical protein